MERTLLRGTSGAARQGDDELWLTVALHDDERGLAAWARLAAHLDLDAVDGGQVRLLPLVRHHLAMWGVDHPETARMAGVERAAWVRTQYLLDAAAEALAALTARGIDTVILKGTALASRAHRRSTLRPMRDIDLLVQPSDVPAAVGVLAELGYTGPSQFHRQATIGRHALPYLRADGAAIDLHWMPHRYLAPRGITRTFRGSPWDADVEPDSCWGRAHPIAFAGSTALLPNSADLLVHACVHGIASAGDGRLQWVTDAAEILRADESFDWDVVIRDARDRHLSLLLGDALDYLAGPAGLPVPAEAVARVRRVHASTRDVVVYHRILNEPGAGPITGEVIGDIGRYLSLTAREPAGVAVKAAPWCLSAWWGVDRPGDLVCFVASRVVRNLWRWLRAKTSRVVASRSPNAPSQRAAKHRI